jgi:hypothetical protein
MAKPTLTAIELIQALRVELAGIEGSNVISPHLISPDPTNGYGSWTASYLVIGPTLPTAIRQLLTSEWEAALARVQAKFDLVD